MSVTLTEPVAVQKAVVVPGHRRTLTEGRLLVLAAILMSALTLRVAVTVFSPLAERIGADVGFGVAVVGVFGMLPAAAFSLAGPLASASIPRLGLERTALVAMLMAGVGMVLRALMSGTAGLLSFSVVALLGMGMGNVVLPPLVKRYFSDRVALTSSFYIMMVQLGTVLPAFVAIPVAEAHGWRASLGVWGLLGFAAAVPWFLTLRNRRDGDPAVRASAPGPSVRTGRAWRSPVAWGLAGMFGMTSLITYSIFTWLPQIMRDAGASAGFAGAMVGLFASVGLIPALAAPTVVARLRNPFTVVVACAVVFCVAFAGLIAAPMAAPIVWVVLLGIGPSTFPMVLTLINLRTRTPDGSAALSGFTQGVGYAVSCAGPLLFGILRTQTGGWLVPFAGLGVALVVLLVSAWQACKPRMLEDTW